MGRMNATAALAQGGSDTAGTGELVSTNIIHYCLVIIFALNFYFIETFSCRDRQYKFG